LRITATPLLPVSSVNSWAGGERGCKKKKKKSRGREGFGNKAVAAENRCSQEKKRETRSEERDTKDRGKRGKKERGENRKILCPGITAVG